MSDKMEELIWGALDYARRAAREQEFTAEVRGLETAAAEAPGAIAAAQLIETARLADAVEGLAGVLGTIANNIGYLA